MNFDISPLFPYLIRALSRGVRFGRTLQTMGLHERSKHKGANNHSQGESKARRKMAAQSRRINWTN